MAVPHRPSRRSRSLLGFVLVGACLLMLPSLSALPTFASLLGGPRLWPSSSAQHGSRLTNATEEVPRPSVSRHASDSGRTLPASLSPGIVGALSLLILVGAALRFKKWLDTPKRPYVPTGGEEHSANTVGASYDEWTRDGVVEHYWGEHIHMGAYRDLSSQSGYHRNDGFVVAFLRATFGRLRDFKLAKYDFIEDMLDWSDAPGGVRRILDVGCGIGGTTRTLARKFPEAEVTGIAISAEQVKRATALAQEAGLKNLKFVVMDALNMTFQDGEFDFVWACESGEHMPDKRRYVEEMVRVLQPGGSMVVATWCERDPDPPFTPEDRTNLDFLYQEWSHPFFISINSYKDLMEGTGMLEPVKTADWTEQTLPSWRHSIWVGAWSPWYVLRQSLGRPSMALSIVREIVTLERFHRAMARGLLQYGMMKAQKKM
uniref:Methyltransferase domain-containing protein n=1 Tax=Noctiluca scintillans TaxID=2966 RepID=A0A7S1EXV6_NOCSC|mmetsp:Transcript_18192/g.48833  ORF Transcript_18192/g.48833 Transcript_18192/m.48833 type:complete len:430 (+) Transcript_18192:55-1344(+)